MIISMFGSSITGIAVVISSGMLGSRFVFLCGFVVGFLFGILGHLPEHIPDPCRYQLDVLHQLFLVFLTESTA